MKKTFGVGLPATFKSVVKPVNVSSYIILHWIVPFSRKQNHLGLGYVVPLFLALLQA